MHNRSVTGIIIVGALALASCASFPPDGGITLANGPAAPEPPPDVPAPPADFSREDGTTDPSPAPSDDTFSDLRVCTEASFDEEADACDEDQADDLERTSTVYCSATAAGASEAVTGRLTLDDIVIQTFETTISPDTIRPVWFGFELDDTLLPGGQWTCTWGVDDTDDQISQPFPIPGPRGDLLDLMACDADEANPAGNCDPDAERTVDQVTRITCSATLSGLDDATLMVDLHDAQGLAASAEPVSVDGPLTTFVANFSAGDGVFAEGTHTCIWNVEDEPSGAAELDIQ